MASLPVRDCRQHLDGGLCDRRLALPQLQHFAQLHHRYWQARPAQGPAGIWLPLTGPSHSLPAAFFQGYPLSLSASSPTANLSIPYPEADNWYLSLQVLCPERPE